MVLNIIIEFIAGIPVILRGFKIIGGLMIFFGLVTIFGITHGKASYNPTKLSLHILFGPSLIYLGLKLLNLN